MGMRRVEFLSDLWPFSACSAVKGLFALQNQKLLTAEIAEKSQRSQKNQ